MNQILNRLSPEIKIPPEETTYSHPYEKKTTDNTGTLYNTVANQIWLCKSIGAYPVKYNDINWSVTNTIEYNKLKRRKTKKKKKKVL